jgi:type IV secretory pathway VirB10-like protein
MNVSCLRCSRRTHGQVDKDAVSTRTGRAHWAASCRFRAGSDMRFVKLIAVATLFAASLAVSGVAFAATPEEIARQRILDANKARAQQPQARPQPQGRPIGSPLGQPQPQPQARPQARPQQEARPQFRPQPEARVQQPQPQGNVRPRDGGERRSEYRSGGGGRDGDRDRGDRIRRGVAVGAGIAIIGGVLGYNAYRGPSRDRVYDRCDRNFPEFDYDTGTFVNDDGDRELCPYLID